MSGFVVLNTIDFRVNEGIRGAIMSMSPRSNPNGAIAQTEMLIGLQRSIVDTGRAIEAEAYQKERQVAALNERTEELNGRIVNVLAAVSDQPHDSDPRAWWQWWGAFTDTDRNAGKRVVRVDEVDVKGDPTAQFYRKECFAAGTPVSTERGPLPIERIQVGDRVLAKQVTTGELAYKPVLYTSVRRPMALVTLKIGDEPITCTGGHRFWVSGNGWVKARDLTPDARLHTATGNALVAAIAAGPSQETYNLVVDDFHTYFVGNARIMVQDLPLPQPSNSVIPGLSRRQLLAGQSR